MTNNLPIRSDALLRVADSERGLLRGRGSEFRTEGERQRGYGSTAGAGNGTGRSFGQIVGNGHPPGAAPSHTAGSNLHRIAHSSKSISFFFSFFFSYFFFKFLIFFFLIAFYFFD